MNFTQFEFAQPLWLYLLILPLLLLLFSKILKQRFSINHRIQQFADPHLLPYLLINQETTKKPKVNKMWFILWLLGVLALAGPRWDYEEQPVVRKFANLMILLDLSDSMRVKDLAQSRLEQALQDIDELLKEKQEVYVGLIVFAGIPHLVTPLTDDYNTIKRLLYKIDFDLLQENDKGSRLTLALTEASRWLTDPNSAALLISDGEFTPEDLQTSIDILKQKHFHLHVLGVGTPQGDYIPLKDHSWLKDAQGNIVISKLNETTLQQLATTSSGIYRRADYRNEDTQAILDEVKRSIHEPSEAENKSQRLWHERFYLLVAIMMLLILPWFRQIRSA